MTKAANEREIVLETLLEITENGQFSHIILRDVLNNTSILRSGSGRSLPALWTELWSI